MNKTEKKAWIVRSIDVIAMVLLLLFDQCTKHLAIDKLKGESPFVLIPRVLELQYLENRGSAFGMFQNQKIFLLLTGILFMTVLLYVWIKLPAQKKYYPLHIVTTLILAGGVGNMIDRVRFDFVVDFISFVLINYPIFNVADMYIVVGALAMFLFFLFVYQEQDLYFLKAFKN